MQIASIRKVNKICKKRSQFSWLIRLGEKLIHFNAQFNRLKWKFFSFLFFVAFEVARAILSLEETEKWSSTWWLFLNLRSSSFLFAQKSREKLICQELSFFCEALPQNYSGRNVSKVRRIGFVWIAAKLFLNSKWNVSNGEERQAIVRLRVIHF